MKFLIGRKLEMIQRFRTDGAVLPVTRIKAGPITIAQVKQAASDGYTAVQVGLTGKKKLSNSVSGHTKNLGPVAMLREFRIDNVDRFARGQTYSVDVFQPGDQVTVTGVSKGKGFAGVVKRHHFKGGPASHGHKDNLRMPGSIGATAPQRVLKGLRMAGRMGGEQTTVTNLEVIAVDPAANELLVRGAVPGPRNGLVMLTADGEMPEAIQSASQPESPAKDEKPDGKNEGKNEKEQGTEK